jgi:hypothetical protein
VADTEYVDPPAVAPLGALEVKLIDCTLGAGAPGPTVNDCCTCGAAVCVASPGWSASIVQVPAPTSATDDPETVQTPALLASAEKTTARPDVALAPTA